MKKLFFPILAFVVFSAFLVEEGDVLLQLRERSSVVYKKLNRSKLDLFFNQPRYSAGDTAYLRTLYFNAADNKPVDGKQIVHIELFDQSGVRALQDQFIVANGRAATNLIIPQKFPAGNYQLIAYTDWMRNFDTSLFFKQDFVIAGQDQIVVNAQKGEATLDFFPEGGALVQDIENNLLLHVNGAGANRQINVYANDQSFATLVTDADGMAEIKLTPHANVKYTADFSIDGKKKMAELPAVVDRGFGLIVSPYQGTGALRVKVQAAASVDKTKKYFLVAISPRGVIFSKLMEPLKDVAAEYTLPEELPSGIAELVITDENFSRLAERPIYIKERSSYSVAIKPSKELFSTREDATVEVEVLDKSGNLVEGQFATRIIKRGMFPEEVHTMMSENLQIYSDIDPTFRLTPPLTIEVLNRYLISQKCPWLNWEKLAGTDAVMPRFAPQSNITLSGKAVFLENGEHVPDSTQIMFFLQKQVFGYEVYTDKNGDFTCPILFDFTGTDQIFFAAMNHGKDLSGIALKLNEKENAYAFKASPWKALSKTQDPYGVYDFKKTVIDHSYRYFMKPKSSTDSVADPNAQIEDELQGADITFKSNDYIIFPTMPDLVREVLRSVDYRHLHGRDIVRIYTTGKRPTNSASPLYVIDGIMTKNTATFIGLKPQDILNIKVIKDSNKLMRFGTLGVNGVILVTTKFAGRKPAINPENVFPLVGLSPKTPAVISATATSSSVPDLRPCLLWAPQQVLNSEGKATLKFTTSDDVGTFLVEVRGVTSTGVPFSAEKVIEVKFQAN